jgi:hypothetical protein
MRQSNCGGGVIELLSMAPYAGRRRTTALPCARGVRFVEVAASQHISTFAPGHRLHLQTEPETVANANVIQITDGRQHLGCGPTRSWVISLPSSTVVSRLPIRTRSPVFLCTLR